MSSPRSSKRWAMYQTTSSVVVAPGVTTRSENASAITPRARDTICGYASIWRGLRVSIQRTTSSSALVTRSLSSGVSTSISRSWSAADRPSATGQWRDTLTPIRFGSRSAITSPSPCHCSSRSPPSQADSYNAP